MKTKDLKINFRYLGGNIACLSVDSIDGESVHNDINNEEAIIIFNSIVGEKENCQTVKTLLKENQELKSQLRGTTHCFDEEEHNKLKEEITNLSKEIDMWNSKYNDMFDENRMLKEALETKSYCKYANKCDELNDCSREEYEDMSNANVRLNVENYDLKEENQTLKKQVEEIDRKLFFTKNELDMRQKSIDNKLNQQKEFINYLEDEIEKATTNPYTKLSEYGMNRIHIYKEILQKYKSIIGE